MIVVLVLDRVSPGLRGDLSRWLVEPKAGVFVGRVTPQVRDKLWNRVSARVSDGACLLVYESPQDEQRVAFRQIGERSRELVDLEGIRLVRLPSLASR